MKAKFINRLRRIALGSAVVGVVLLSAGAYFAPQGWLVFIPLSLLVSWLLFEWGGARLKQQLNALSNAAYALEEGDYSLEIVSSGHADELDLFAQAYNSIVTGLRSERLEIFQREQVLDALVHSAPQALMLLDETGRIVLDNPAARGLLQCEVSLIGHRLADELSLLPLELRDAFNGGREGFISASTDNGEDTYQLQKRVFPLRGQLHTLWQVHLVTNDLARQETLTWKKVIRVISHEVNNSLAPVSSMAHSARKLLERQQVEKVDEVLRAIADRSTHLADFIDSYAAFARVPEPQCAWLDLQSVLEGISHTVAFGWNEIQAKQLIWADQAQLEQVLINLVKNAHEADSPLEAIRVNIREESGGLAMSVTDRGRGMSEQARAMALLPFYTTKQTGNGLGLALARDIVLAHEGQISLCARAPQTPGGPTGTEVRLFFPKPRSVSQEKFLATASDFCPVDMGSKNNGP